MKLIIPYFIMLVIGLCFQTSAYAQDELSAAEAVFPEAEIVRPISTVNYSFKKDKRSKKALIEEERTDRIMSLKGEQQFSYVVYYDDYSEVSSLVTDYKVYDEKYNSDDYFHSDVRVKYSNCTLRGKGTKTNVQVSKVYKDVKYLTKVFLTTQHACLKRKISFNIPKEFEVELVEVNFDGLKVEKKETKNGKGKTITYEINNIEGFARMPNAPGATYIYPHILILTKSYKDKDGEEVFLNSLDALYDWYKSLVDDIENDPSSLQPLVDELTEGIEDENEKVRRIFYWVQDNIRYIAFEDGIAGFQPENCQTVFFNRYGDCKGMANLTKEMLKLAGFDARLVWLGTKSVATDYSTPCLASDNHMICAVKLGEEFVYLDGTEKFTPLGTYAERIQNQEVLIEDGEGYIRSRIPVQNHLQNSRLFALKLSMNEQQELIGEVRSNTKGEAMSTIQYFLNRTATDKKSEVLGHYLTLGHPFALVTELEVPDLDRNAHELDFHGTIQLKNRISSFDDELYVYLDPYQFFEEYDLEEDRKFALWMPYKQNDQIEVEFEVPNGYSISSLPEALEVQNEDFDFKVSYRQDRQRVYYTAQFQLPKASVEKEQLEAWNDAVKALKEFYEQPLILTKKSK